MVSVISFIEFPGFFILLYLTKDICYRYSNIIFVILQLP